MALILLKLPSANEIQVGRQQNSFAALYHCADTPRALAEAARVLRPGDELKFMLYDRRSILAVKAWVKRALAKGKPWKILGTKSYTRKEIAEMLEGLGIGRIVITTEVTSADTLAAQALPPLNAFFRLLVYLAGVTYPWRKKLYDKGAGARLSADAELSVGGSALGFFHCISGIKK